MFNNHVCPLFVQPLGSVYIFIRVFIYAFFIIQIVFSLNKVEFFPIFGWAMYSYTHPYRTLYIVKIVPGNKEPTSLHTYTKPAKYEINKTLSVLGNKINSYSQRDSEELKKARTQLEKYMLKHVSPPFSYRLVKQKVHLPFYVLSKEGSVLSKEIILKGNL